MFGARFDDVAAQESFVLIHPVEALAAHTHEEVRDVITGAADAARGGAWVAGYVAYEAAPNFDPSFATRVGSDRHLAWFGVFEDRRSVPVAMHDPRAGGGYAISKWSPVIDKDDYQAMFEVAMERMRSDGVGQIKLTFPLRAAFTGSAEVFYDDLVCAQRPAYASHVWHDDVHVLSVSPERLFSVDNGVVTAQPMKGTAPRGRWLEEDEMRREGLAASQRDRSEHSMIVDELRRELARITRQGTVAVQDLFSIERYRTVWQMSSTVTGHLLPEVDLLDVFDVLFPSGSVTGVPKAASTAIIAEVEPDSRGVYCGTVGYIPPGDGLSGASFNVAIRTVEIDEAEGVANYGVGGGITPDSVVDTEFDEAVTTSEILRFDVSPLQLIEAVRWDDGWLWLDDHLDRLERSASYWGFKVDRYDVITMLEEAAASCPGASKIRVVAQPDGSVFVTAEPLHERWLPGPGPSSDPATLAIDLEPIDTRNPRLFHQTSDRRAFVVRAERHPRCEDVLLVNRFGYVTQASVANVAFLIDERWVTPPVTDGLVAGIMRGHLIADGMLEERSVSIHEALGADAVALVSSVQGWRPALLVEPSAAVRRDG
jgi:para-aminobenzoate synthetase/4-amino-4-deoxychorismate lyase